MLCDQDIPILVAKPDDGVSVGKVLSQTQVVIATAGPFAKYGNTVSVGDGCRCGGPGGGRRVQGMEGSTDRAGS